MLHFPTDFCAGKLSIQDAGRQRELKYTFWANDGPWERIGPAMGDVTIPAGKRVWLIVYDTTWTDVEKLEVLKQLKADDLYYLTLSGDWTGPDAEPPTDRCIPYITHLTGLKVLNLSGSHISQNGLKQLSALTSLERIYLPDGLTNGGLGQVTQIPSLEAVYVMRNNRLTDKALQLLRRLPRLKELALCGDLLTNEALGYLGEMPLLEYLFLNPPFGDEALKHLRSLGGLKILYLFESPVTDAGMQYLSQVSTLEEIQAIRVGAITDEGVGYLTALPNLKRLNMYHEPLTNRSLQMLSQMQSLESLDLPFEGITDEGVAALANLRQLKRLWVCAWSNSPLTDRSLEAVSGLGNLEALTMSGTGFTDEGMQHLLKLKHLKEIVCTAPNVTDTGFATLGRLENLEQLSWGSETKVTLAGVNHLSRLKKLKSLSLRNIRKGDVVLDIGGMESLESLTISTTWRSNRDTHTIEFSESFTDADFACFAKLKKLETVQISGGEQVGDAALAHLQDLKNMIFLNIYGTSSITDAGLVHLQGMDRLWRLHIKDGHFTDKALDILAELVSLEWLELTSDTAFSNAAIEAFKAKKNLQVLKLMP